MKICARMSADVSEGNVLSLKQTASYSHSIVPGGFEVTS
jgi:hypothetical protein